MRAARRYLAGGERLCRRLEKGGGFCSDFGLVSMSAGGQFPRFRFLTESVSAAGIPPLAILLKSCTANAGYRLEPSLLPE